MSEYLYRVDSLNNLREIRDGQFRPVLWMEDDDLGRHKLFIDLQENLNEDSGIFRICFWNTENLAREDFSSRRFNGKYLILRIRRSDVLNCLQSYKDDEDDLLPGKARMFWSIEALRDGQSTTFAVKGIPVEKFEVWEDDGNWSSWAHATLLLPDNVRMARIGMKQVFYQGFMETNYAFWKIVHVEHDQIQHCLVIRHSDKPGTYLTNDDSALHNVISHAIQTSNYKGSQIGVLIVSGSAAQAHYSTYLAQRYQIRKQASKINRLIECLGLQKEVHWGVKTKRIPVPENVKNIIRESALYLAM